MLFLAIATLTRLALTLHTGLDMTPLALWPGLFLRGIGFDLAVLAWLFRARTRPHSRRSKRAR